MMNSLKTNMLISQEKIQDMQIRDNMLELMEISLRLGDTEAAKLYGETAKKYGDRIKTFDYPQRDAWMRPLPTTKDVE